MYIFICLAEENCTKKYMWYNIFASQSGVIFWKREQALIFGFLNICAVVESWDIFKISFRKGVLPND